jgi:short subunit dehydrogenase-like uncharacterized protein
MADDDGSERRWLIYGANGYTGRLTAAEAVARGLRPILAGRDAEPVRRLAEELGLEHRVFPLTDPGSLRAALTDVEAVLHCAGPFVETSRPMVQACLASAAHYLDITGEITVFEAVFARHEAACEAGVCLLPGVGFDVVPTDCLAARLAEALPDASELDLAFVNDRGGLSRGTARTMVKNLPHLGAVRRDGRIVPVPAAWKDRELLLPRPGGGELRRRVMTVPWGDVSTAYHTTGIPNIRVFTGVPPATLSWLRRLRPLIPLTGLGPVKRLIMARTERRFADQKGPDEATRESSRVFVWGEARTADGRRAVGTLTTPEGYTFTARAAVECVQRLLAASGSADAVPAGTHTPARAFGADLVEAIEGVKMGELRLESAAE